jgi:antitoxin (DNA-binding transcriptional repressor) of toxin-antitoxin stability system
MEGTVGADGQGAAPLELLHTLTLVTDLEPDQAQLLDDVMAGERITVSGLTDAGVLPVPATARSPLPKATKKDNGFEQAELLPSD